MLVVQIVPTIELQVEYYYRILTNCDQKYGKYGQKLICAHYKCMASTALLSRNTLSSGLGTQPVNTTHGYTNCCLYRVDLPEDEQQDCSKHVGVNY